MKEKETLRETSPNYSELSPTPYRTQSLDILNHHYKQHTINSNEEVTPPGKTNYRDFGIDGGTPKFCNNETRFEKYNSNLRAFEHKDHKLNIDLPSFTGYTHIQEFMDWMQVIKKFLDVTDILGDKKVKLVA